MAKRIGIFGIVISFVFYGLLFVVPFLPFATATKAGIATGLVVAGEITFWGGGLLLGREAVKKYRQYMNPAYWFGRNARDRKERGEET
ncbi:transporter suffix domain-containing protein [Paenibacillus sp.]|uniref:transporter suffix domain-containing protein n=1 Tax=Paenibacillus sp. TaxID=58172 RepID=UPI002D2B41BF|nr:transporter suffix domain-containing protein [Paenibacillus sp.]HZG57089.1 transporter suffix domain-containing protein [Paenibacillus sp.]